MMTGLPTVSFMRNHSLGVVWTKCVKASGKRLCTRVCVVNVGLMTAGGLKGLGAAKDKVSK